MSKQIDLLKTRYHRFVDDEAGRRPRTRKQIDFLKDLYRRFVDDEVEAVGAQLTYYLILAFFPFLIFLVTVVNFTPLTSDQVLNDLISLLPADTKQLVVDILTEVLPTNSPALLSIGMIGTIWASSAGVMAVIRGLNKAYDAEETRPFWKVRGMSIVFTLVIILMIIISFLLLVFGQFIGQHLFRMLDYPDGFNLIWSIIKFFTPIAVSFLIFMFMCSAFPNRHLKFKAVLPGTIFAAVSLVAISYLFSIYVNSFANYSKVYGSIGGIIILLVWIYFSSILMILGGEINASLEFMRQGRAKEKIKKFSP